jgi:hypothetical protein
MDWHLYEINNDKVTITEKKLFEISKSGWLLAVICLTDDAYCTLKLRWKGAGTREREIIFTPELGHDYGAFTQDPAGAVQKYYRPDPNSTAGIYVFSPFTGGFQGAPFSYIEPIKISAYLASGTTQEEAYLAGTIGVIEIFNEKLFEKSYEKISGLKYQKEIIEILKKIEETRK